MESSRKSLRFRNINQLELQLLFGEWNAVLAVGRTSGQGLPEVMPHQQNRDEEIIFDTLKKKIWSYDFHLMYVEYLLL